MNREIIFRGKSIDTGKWLYGNLQVPGKPGVEYFMWDEELWQRAVDPDTIGQYTGLKDKNGDKIFEGDILKGQEYSIILEYNERQAEFVAVNSALPNGVYLPMSQRWIDEEKLVICGNIHDNPELIK